MGIKYSDIAVYLQEMLQEGLGGEVDVKIEPDILGESINDEVGIRLETQKNVEMTIGSAEPYLSTLEYSVFCSVYHPDGVLESYRKRESLVERVQSVLGTDRTLGGLVGATQLGDIEFDFARTETGYFSAANVKLTVFVIS